MIVDTSAIMAILLGEPDAPRFANAMFDADRNAVSAGSWIELSAVLVRGRHDLGNQLQALVDHAGLVIEPLTQDQGHIGHQAYREFGQGSGHRARLNFGDCFAYALARDTGEPLLFKGDDFIHTDITPAL